MKRTIGNGLAMGVVALLIAIGAACNGSSPTTEATETPFITITNIQVTTPTPQPSPTPGEYMSNPTQGESIYTQQCAACHGPGGTAGFAPPLNTSGFQEKYPDDDTLTTLLRTGRGGMPAYGPNRLSDEQMADLVSYIRSLQ